MMLKNMVSNIARSILKKVIDSHSPTFPHNPWEIWISIMSSRKYWLYVITKNIIQSFRTIRGLEIPKVSDLPTLFHDVCTIQCNAFPGGNDSSSSSNTSVNSWYALPKVSRCWPTRSSTGQPVSQYAGHIVADGIFTPVPSILSMTRYPCHKRNWQRWLL